VKMSTNEIDRRKNFHIAVEAIFKNWTALQMAVKQGSAGPQSQAIASWLVEATVQWFSENKNLEVFEVEEYLEDILNHEFNLVVDDGSVKETGKLVCEYYNICTDSNITAESVYEKLKKLPKCDLSQYKVDSTIVLDSIDDDQDLEIMSKNKLIVENSVKIQTTNSDNSEIEMMEVGDITNNTDDGVTATTQTDADGWTIVSRKKK